jgi:competence ComEA-like helix-hairpin-helix protein
MKSVMLFGVAIVCGLILSVDVATGSQAKSGEDLFVDKCGTCHGTDRALVAPRTKKGWESVLTDMANLGATLEAAEQEAILGFLAERHGLVNVNTATADELVALGLSKKDADTIGSYRTEHGPFADFESLQRVPGLDADRLNAVRARVAFRD